MKQLYFFDLQPMDMEEKHSENHHLIKFLVDTVADKGSWPDKRKSHCGRYSMKSDAHVRYQLIIPDSFKYSDGNPDPDKYHEDEYMDYVRLYLAQNQNAGIDYCAHCVAKFYKFEEGDE